jgi:hypothetical protein
MKGREGEQGYVLLAAIWLLILSGSIVAALTIAGGRASQRLKDEGGALKARLAVQAALQTVIADRLIKSGPLNLVRQESGSNAQCRRDLGPSQKHG